MWTVIFFQLDKCFCDMSYQYPDVILINNKICFIFMAYYIRVKTLAL
jgi:hypothetical protein